MYKVGKFAAKVGVCVKTIQRWDKSGKLPARRTVAGYRYYTDDDVRTAKGLQPYERERKTVVYCRVSSSGQKSELANQVAAMTDYCASRGIDQAEYITEIGGGLNFKRKKFLSIIFSLLNGEIDFLVIAHKDRLCRFAFDFIQELAWSQGCEILIANRESTSAQQELVEDLLAVVHCFSCRLYGLRSYTKDIKVKVVEALDNPGQEQVYLEKLID